MRMLLIWAVLMMVSPFSSRGENSTGDLYQNILKCGPNSLYLFLRLAGRTDVTPEELEKLPASSSGTSLLTLRDAAKAFKVDAEVRHFEPSQIDLLTLPAIGRFNSISASLSPYHFMLIHKVDSMKVYLIDGTTGQNRVVLRDRLERIWTGDALVRKRSFPDFLGQGPLANVTVALIIFDCVVVAGFVLLLQKRSGLAIWKVK